MKAVFRCTGGLLSPSGKLWLLSNSSKPKGVNREVLDDNSSTLLLCSTGTMGHCEHCSVGMGSRNHDHMCHTQCPYTGGSTHWPMLGYKKTWMATIGSFAFYRTQMTMPYNNRLIPNTRHSGTKSYTLALVASSFPDSHALEREHWSCTGVESLVFFHSWLNNVQSVAFLFWSCHAYVEKIPGSHRNTYLCSGRAWERGYCTCTCATQLALLKLVPCSQIHVSLAALTVWWLNFPCSVWNIPQNTPSPLSTLARFSLTDINGKR